MPILLLVIVLLSAGCSGLQSTSSIAPKEQDRVGKLGALVMAHGGSEDWNYSVEEAIESLSQEMPTALAFGMANPLSLSNSLESLNAQGVTHVAVVRLFLSGSSFLEQTRFLLGLSDIPPKFFVLMGPGSQNANAREQIQHSQVISTHSEGLINSEYTDSIMLERANSLSSIRSEESVLIIAHGMGEEEENNNLLKSMERVARHVAKDGYADVHVATLREDWEPKRILAEQDIRSYVSRQNEAGRRVLVLPMRLSGFGPYAEVLDGLKYSAGLGLLPHKHIANWAIKTAYDVSRSSGWNLEGPSLSKITRD